MTLWWAVAQFQDTEVESLKWHLQVPGFLSVIQIKGGLWKLRVLQSCLLNHAVDEHEHALCTYTLIFMLFSLTWHYSIYQSILCFLFHLYTFPHFALHHTSGIWSCGTLMVTLTVTLRHMHQSPQDLPSISCCFQSGSLAYHESWLPSKP